ncbi:MAG: SPOR domain-containing protein [Halieaceae bacterium]|nr:SPOR domain-containing protein [Halieaceae bacterium]
MNDILKQRLVGALVLIALGVIFWPVLFVEGERGSLDRETQLEPMPALEDVTIPAPQPIDGVEPARPAPEPTPEELAALPAEADQEAAPEPEPEPAPAPQPKPKPKPKPKRAAVPPLPDTEGERAAPASPALDDQGIPIAWVLQVASVSSREKADQLTASLIGHGYKAYHRAIRRDDAVLYRVFIGPVFEREKLAAVKRDIDKQLNVSALIARYVP